MSLLLAKPRLRKTLAEDPTALQEELQLDGMTLAFLRGLDSKSLESQADCLVNKRFYEVRRIIPRTVKSLGKNDRGAFRTYAVENWPVSHKRHLLDAEAFAVYCLGNELGVVDPFELNCLRFRLAERGFRVRIVRDRKRKGLSSWRFHLMWYWTGSLREKRW